MRTITLPPTPAALGIRIRFHHWFGTPYQSLGLRYHKLPGGNGTNDAFLYDRSDFQPRRLAANVPVHTSAPARNVKSMVFCEIAIGRFGFGGCSFCYTDDVYNRQTGERWALRRALDRIDEMQDTTGFALTGAQRKRVWEVWLESYKAAAKEWTATAEVPQAAIATGRLFESQPAVQDLPRKSEDIIRLLELLSAFTGLSIQPPKL